MARELLLPPSAKGLSRSMRDIGYTLETAIADLVDNSITAGARQVDICCIAGARDPLLTVTDDGCGMDEEEVIDAMRHGGRIRTADDINDLGKFGLGLKTASFSQCTRLTVISRKNGRLSGAEWDLCVVDERDEWIVSVLDANEIARLPNVSVSHPSGTVVLWRDLDRLTEGTDADQCSRLINEKLAVLVKHLGLVFHRFLAGDVTWHAGLKITVNGHPVPAIDPFFVDNAGIQRLPVESVDVANGHRVRIQPYVLPHFSKLPESGKRHYGDPSTFVQQQGAYVYRNCRLLVWGTWFRLHPKSETSKLARVQIDYTRALDDYWTIDIKKSTASPPKAVRTRLRQIFNPVADRSKQVYQSRGWTRYSKQRYPLWSRIEDRGCIRYQVSENHPVYAAILKQLTPESARQLRFFIRSLEAALPIESIYADWAGAPRRVAQTKVANGVDIQRKLDLLARCIGGIKNGQDAEAFSELARGSHLFQENWEDVEAYIKSVQVE